jgi:hypothetical protein
MFDGFLKFSLEGTRHSCLQGQVHTNEEAQSQITMGVKADLKSHLNFLTPTNSRDILSFLTLSNNESICRSVNEAMNPNVTREVIHYENFVVIIPVLIK